MIETLNFLHLPKKIFNPELHKEQYEEALFREKNIEKQVQSNGITNYKVWDGIYDTQIPFRAISYAHKRIVQDAKDNGLSSVCIGEDDMNFSSPGSWEYYRENEPKEYDLYLGCVFNSKIDSEGRLQFGFSGMTLYTVHERFYDFFLGVNPMNNIDRELGRFCWKHKYIVCQPFVCEQLAGYSYHQRKNIESYEHLLEGRTLYGRTGHF